MRRSAVLVILILVATSATFTNFAPHSAAAGADSPKTFLLPKFSDQISDRGIAAIFDDSQSVLGYASGLGDKEINSNSDGTQSMNTKVYCKSLNDKACENTKKFTAYAILPPCKLASDQFCIESVYSISNEKKYLGNFVETLPSASPTNFIGDNSLGLPSGSNPSVWEIPEIKNSSGSALYTVIVSTRGEGSRSTPSEAPKFSFNEYATAIYASSLKSGSYSVVTAEGSGNDAVTGDGCAASSETKCAFRESFIMDGTSFGISIRFPKIPSNWFYGRLSKQSLNLNANPNGQGVILNVVGEPVTVPVVYGKSPWEKLPAELQKIYSGSFPSVGNNYFENDKNKWNVTHIAASNDFEALNSWLKIVKDTAVTQTTQWYFKASTFGVDPKCNSNKLQVDGLVTSNATAYIPGPPQFNPQSASLEYQVSAPHFTPEGNQFKGSYDLAISADQARCIYGFKGNFPVKASVSIVSENGIEQIASESIGEKDGWLRLGAYNFTFSTPKLRVKLTQEKDPTTPVQSSEPSPSNDGGKVTIKNQKIAKSYQIKCLNGKKSFVKQGVNPKCPKGYKLLSRKEIS